MTAHDTNEVLIWTRAHADWPADAALWQEVAPDAWQHQRVISLPCITTQAAAPAVPRKQAIAVAWSSAKAVAALAAREDWQSALAKLPHFCIGAGTAAAVQAQGWTVAHVGHGAGGEAWLPELSTELAELVAPSLSAGSLAKLWCPQGSQVAFDLVGHLQVEGLKAEAIVCYETTSGLWTDTGQPADVAMKAQWIRNWQGRICFASPSAVAGFAAELKPQSNELHRRLIAIAIGSTTANAAREHFDAVRIAPAARLRDLIRTAIA